MNPLLRTGMTIVILALVCYTIAFSKEIKKKALTRSLLIYFSIGLFFDITATTFMIIGSPNSPFSFHGFVGYSALMAMIIEVFLLWKLHLKSSEIIPIPKSIHLYTKFAYFWWVLAFITGGLIVALK
jgi:hypothetical protein